MTGRITTTGDLEIEGEVDGIVDARRLKVGPRGRVRATLEADDAVVSGNAVGVIKARGVTFTDGCRFTGEVQYEQIGMEPEANVEGRMIPVVDGNARTHADHTTRTAPAGARPVPNIPRAAVAAAAAAEAAPPRRHSWLTTAAIVLVLIGAAALGALYISPAARDWRTALVESVRDTRPGASGVVERATPAEPAISPAEPAEAKPPEPPAPVAAPKPEPPKAAPPPRSPAPAPEPVKTAPPASEPVMETAPRPAPPQAPAAVTPRPAREPAASSPEKAGPVKAGPVKAGPVKAAPVKAPPVEAEPVKAEPVVNTEPRAAVPAPAPAPAPTAHQDLEQDEAPPADPAPSVTDGPTQPDATAPKPRMKPADKVPPAPSGGQVTPAPQTPAGGRAAKPEEEGCVWVKQCPPEAPDKCVSVRRCDR